MKSFRWLILLGILILVACSSSAEPDLSMEDFIQAYESHGVEIDPNEKQIYQMANAIDGVIFYQDNKPVKIYEYKSEKDLQRYKKEDSMVQDWPTNGRFMLETSNDQAIEIFNSVQ